MCLVALVNLKTHSILVGKCHRSLGITSPPRYRTKSPLVTLFTGQPLPCCPTPICIGYLLRPRKELIQANRLDQSTLPPTVVSQYVTAADPTPRYRQALGRVPASRSAGATLWKPWLHEQRRCRQRNTSLYPTKVWYCRQLSGNRARLVPLYSKHHAIKSTSACVFSSTLHAGAIRSQQDIFPN